MIQHRMDDISRRTIYIAAKGILVGAGMTKRQNEERIERQRIGVHVWRYGKLKMYARQRQVK